VTGGYVYRGSLVPELKGNYIFADFISGMIWRRDLPDSVGAPLREPFDSGLPIASFGVNAANELFICSFDGKIYRFVSQQ
jgi:hypothetical protein